jgi:murein L,D-transpeptidase YafK
MLCVDFYHIYVNSCGILKLGLAGSNAYMPPAGKASSMPEIVIDKSLRRLRLTQAGREVFSCPVGLGPKPLGAKCAEGDGRTPEGEYRICTRNSRSRYTLFLGLSYPAPADAQAAFARGDIAQAALTAILAAHHAGRRPPWDTALGGEIGIHGGGVPQNNALADNTAGCIALLDGDIRRLWALAPLGTRVVIRP